MKTLRDKSVQCLTSRGFSLTKAKRIVTFSERQPHSGLVKGLWNKKFGLYAWILFPVIKYNLHHDAAQMRLPRYALNYC